MYLCKIQKVVANCNDTFNAYQSQSLYPTMPSECSQSLLHAVWSIGNFKFVALIFYLIRERCTCLSLIYNPQVFGYNLII